MSYETSNITTSYSGDSIPDYLLFCAIISLRGDLMIELDCGDSSCIFTKNKTGMRTNGGCRCFDRAGLRTRSAIAAAYELLPMYLDVKEQSDSLKSQIAQLEAHIAYLEPIAREAQEPLNECIMLLTAIRHQTSNDFELYRAKAAKLLDRLGFKE